jgi:GntR family transcriptional regulator of arabinose operon
MQELGAKSKYLIVQEWIKSEINKGTYANGDKIPSENELMEQFGYSRQTIRLAISNLENEGYLDRVKGSGTYVNVSSLRGEAQTHNIGVIMRHLDYYIYPEIIRGIENTLMLHGYTMALGITHNRSNTEAHILNSMMEKKLDGIIAEPCRTTMPMPTKLMYERIASQLPLLFIGGGYHDLDIPVAAMDYKEAAETAVKYLIKMGHRNIGGIFRSDEIGGHLRYEGFTTALLENNLAADEKNVMWYTADISESFFETMFKQFYFSGLNRCTAIVCQNDKLAEAMIEYLKGLNITPFEDVSIISFDNSRTAKMLGLTSMSHAKAELGARAAELLIKHIKTNEKKGELIKSSLIVRDSVHRRSFENSWESSGELFEIQD